MKKPTKKPPIGPYPTMTVAPLTAPELEQVNRVIQGCIAMEDYLAARGLVLQSGTIAAARQVIRLLASRLVAPEPEKKA